MSDQGRSQRHPFFAPCLLILVLAVFAVYGKTMDYGFVFDDLQFVIANTTIRAFDTIINFFNSGFPLTRITTFFTFALNYKMSGLHPSGYHAVNLLIHLAASCAAWWVAGLLLERVSFLRAGAVDAGEKDRRFWLAFFIALLFCVHPIQTQAVAYVTQRFSSLAALFYFFSVGAYIRLRSAATPGARVRAVFLLVLCGLLAVTSKEEAVTLPLMLLVVEVMFFQGFKAIMHSSRHQVIVIAAGLLCYLVFAALFKDHLSGAFTRSIVSECHDGDVLNGWTYLLSQAKVFTIFVRLCFWPFPQNFDYDIPMPHAWSDERVIVGLLLAFVLLMAAWRARKAVPLVSFGIAWFFVAFAANLVPRSNVIWEHKLYLISFGFMVALVMFLDRVIRNGRVLFAALAILAIFWGVSAHARTGVWAGALTLWQDAHKHSPDKSRVNVNLASAYADLKQYDLAEKYYMRAIDIVPRDVSVNMCVAAFYAQKGDQAKAVSFYEKVLAMEPMNVQAYQYKAKAYEKMGDYASAEATYAQAISLMPDKPALYIWRGGLYLKMKEYAKAIKDYALILHWNPRHPLAVIGMSHVLIAQGKPADALALVDNALKVSLNDENLFLQRAHCHMLLGRDDLAEKDIARAMGINPHNEFFRKVMKR